jgi:hypothetical protein
MLRNSLNFFFFGGGLFGSKFHKLGKSTLDEDLQKVPLHESYVILTNNWTILGSAVCPVLESLLIQ